MRLPKSLRLLLAGALVAPQLTACGRSEPPVAAAPPSTVQPSAEASPGPAPSAPTASLAGQGPAAAGAAAAPAPADPGPVLEHESGKTQMVAGDAVTLPARVEVTDGRTYVVAEVPAGTFGGGSDLSRGRLTVTGADHGVAALGRGEGFGAAVQRVVVRLASDRAPEKLTLQSLLPEGDTTSQPWTRRAVTLAPLTPDTGPERLRDTFFRDFGADLAHLGGDGFFGDVAPFHAFASGRARRLAGESLPTPEARRNARRGELSDMMRLYTGLTSIDEALQADRGLLLRGDPASARTVPLSSVTAIPLAAHPWERIQKTLGQAPVVEPLAAVVPDGLLYVHFHDLRTAVKLMGEVDAWLTPFAQAAEGRAGTTHLTERYERQLMIERLGLAEKLGHLAASGFALVAGDPFFREGTDVALVFRVQQRALLAGALATYEQRARAQHPSAAETTYELAGRTVRRVSTPDRAIDQHRLELGDVLIVANSRRTLERFVAVADGKAPSLAQAGDFRTMRALYPFDVAAEDGYVFLGDRFVAEAVSPRTKILQARRMDAAADLGAVGYAALLHGWLEGRPPASTEALVASGLLQKEELAHADGTAITFDPASGARSATWGTLAALTPIAELTLDKVSPAEQQAYDAFRETYQSYWQTFIDPVAIRLVRSADGQRVAADARMLPLIAQSEYDELIELVGRTRALPPILGDVGAGHGAQWTFAVGADARLRRELDQIGRMTGSSDIGFGWLGQWVAIGLADRAGLWDLALLSGDVPEAGPRERIGEREPRFWQIVSRIPIHVAAEVGNPLALATTLTGLRAMAASAAPGMIAWGEAGKHRDVPIVAVRAERSAQDLPPGADQVALHYAIVKNVFVASLDRATVEQQIGRVLDGHATRTAEAGADAAVQAELQVAPRKGGYLAQTLLGLAEASMRPGLRTALRDTEALARGLGGLPADPDARRRAALGYLGYEPASVQGGTFGVDADGFGTHSLYGSEMAPVYPAIPVENAPLTRLVEAVERLAGGLAFEGEGDTRGLRVRFEWRRR